METKRNREEEGEEQKQKKSKRLKKDKHNSDTDSSSSSSSEEEQHQHKDFKSSKKSKKSKEKEKKKHKKDKKKHKHKSKSKDDSVNPKDIIQISEDNYFDRNPELRLWLFEEHNIHFDDLSTEDAHKQFAKFVEKWNAGRVPSKFYKGVGMHETNDPSTRTSYKWGFAKKLDVVEMGNIRDSVEGMTQSKKVLEESKQPAPENKDRRVIGPTFAPKGGNLDDEEDEEDRQQRQRLEAKRARKAEEEKRERILDEIAPRETGREAMLAKKRAKGEYTRRERDDFVEMNDSDLMGGEDFKSRLQAEKLRQQRRQEAIQKQQGEKQNVIQDKFKAFQSKEEATLAMFREMAKNHKLGKP